MENIWMHLIVGVLFIDRLHAALMQIQNMLIEALAKQELAEDALAQKFRWVPLPFVSKSLQIHRGHVKTNTLAYSQSGVANSPHMNCGLGPEN